MEVDPEDSADTRVPNTGGRAMMIVVGKKTTSRESWETLSVVYHGQREGEGTTKMISRVSEGECTTGSEDGKCPQ